MMEMQQNKKHYKPNTLYVCVWDVQATRKAQAKRLRVAGNWQLPCLKNNLYKN